MTIQERAKKNATIFAGYDDNLKAGFEAGYIVGATDQKKIDDKELSDALFLQHQQLTEKACESLYVLMNDMGCDLLDIDKAQEAVKNFMMK